MQSLAGSWRVVIERTFETATSLLGAGLRGRQPVILKIIKHQGDEWNSGLVLAAFGGRGVASVYEYVEGAVLMEQLKPGYALANKVVEGRDDEATEILAEVVRNLSGRLAPQQCPTIEKWAGGFERYAASGDTSIAPNLVAHAQRIYLQLCSSQKELTLLHGDLHHYNVLLDSSRGWLAIDPKGAVGEIEYEIGAVLRNPTEQLNFIASPRFVERRIQLFGKHLGLDEERLLGWTFSQAVLSAIWSIEDGYDPVENTAVIRLALAAQELIGI